MVLGELKHKVLLAEVDVMQLPGGGVLFDDQRPQGVEIQLSMMGLSSDLGGRTFYILKTLPNFIITHAASVSGLASVFHQTTCALP